MTIALASIYRYPIKGFSPESLNSADIAERKPLEWDRAFAIENGASGFVPEAPVHISKARFLMLMKQPELAKLRTRFDPDTGALTITLDGQTVAQGNLLDASQQEQILEFLASYCAKPPRGDLKILHASGHAFTDSRTQDLTLINLASVRDLSQVAGSDLDPLRFRGNLYIDGAQPWQEHEWVGKRLKIGGQTFHVRKRTVRCAATNANPTTGERDQNLPKLLLQNYGHADCGIHLMPETSGRIAPGDSLSIED